MTDLYLLLTPVLALAVLALARFVACDLIFKLEDPPPPIPFVESFVLGEPRTDFTGWVGMVIQVGPAPLTVRQLGRIMLTASTVAHEVKLVQPAGTGGVDLGTVTIPVSAATQGFAYATLQPSVVLDANSEYYVVSHEVSGGDAFHDVLQTTVTTRNVAQVTSGVFNDDADPRFQRSGGPGSTYGPVDFTYQEPA